MRRILLTQSQVGVVFSSGVVLLFTILLFLSGYVLQQQTVTGLKDAIKPRLPHPPPSLVVQPRSQSPELQPSRLFGGRGEGHVARTDYNKVKQYDSTKIDWKRLAHVQIARNHHDVCNAIMVLAEFHKKRSPARRLLLFPRSWAAEKKAEKGDISDPFMESSRRLMRLAARRYGVELRPIAPLVTAATGEGDAGDVYSLISAYGQKDVDRLLHVETPGLVMDASSLDAVLAFTEDAPFAMVHSTDPSKRVHAEDLLLLKPSGQIHTALTKELTNQENFNDTDISAAFPDPLLLQTSADNSALVRSIGVLHDVGTVFNATAFVSDVSYIRFSDPKLPGPEYDVPWSDRLAARPKNKEADWVWTKLYGQFTQKRMEICGLDLDHWRPDL